MDVLALIHLAQTAVTLERGTRHSDTCYHCNIFLEVSSLLAVPRCARDINCERV